MRGEIYQVDLKVVANRMLSWIPVETGLTGHSKGNKAVQSADRLCCAKRAVWPDLGNASILRTQCAGMYVSFRDAMQQCLLG